MGNTDENYVLSTVQNADGDTEYNITTMSWMKN